MATDPISQTPPTPPTPPSKEESGLAAVCHIAAMVGICLGIGHLLIPLFFLWFSDSPFVKSQARESLNWQISLTIWGLICVGLCFTVVGIPVAIVLAIVLSIFGILLPILAAITVLGGTPYRYRMTFRLIK